MNELQKPMMDAPSFVPHFCAACHKTWPPVEAHHVVPRSAGGTDGPRISLCRTCHEKVHAQRTLHFDFRQGEWHMLTTPMALKMQDALDSDGWTRL